MGHALTGKAKLLKIYVGEGMHSKGKPLYHTIVLKLKEMGFAGATVTRGIEGYGFRNKLNTSRIIDLSSDLPIVIEVVDTAERVESAIPLLKKLLINGLIFTVDVEVHKYGNAEE